MRFLAALLLFLTALGSAGPASAAIDTLARDAELRWVPFELNAANQIRFTLMVDGKPVGAILDTGVSYSVLSRRWVEAAKMKALPGARAVAIGGMVAAGWVDTRSLSLGGLTRLNGRVAVAYLPAAATGGGPAVEMLVGRDLTAGYALDIDYAAKRFRLLPSGRMPFRGLTAPLSIGGGWPVYIGELVIDGRRIGRIVVDTGDGNAVTLSRGAWRSLAPLALPTSSTISFGIGGAAVTDLAILPELRSGDLVAHNIELGIEGNGGFSDAIGMAGRIGSGFLHHYRVLLDPGAGRMILSPGDSANAPPLRSTSGLLLKFDGDRLDVIHVMRGGPAAATGWRTGDQICSVDGAPVANDLPTTSWPIGAPGRIVSLGLCDGATRMLTLRRFY